MVATRQVAVLLAVNREDRHRSIRAPPIRLQLPPVHSRPPQLAPQGVPARTNILDSHRALHHQCISRLQLDLTPHREHTSHLGIVLTKHLLLHNQERQAFRLEAAVVRLVQATRQTDQHQDLEDIKQAAVQPQGQAVGHPTTQLQLCLSLPPTGTTKPAASIAMALRSLLSTSSQTVWIRWQ